MKKQELISPFGFVTVRDPKSFFFFLNISLVYLVSKQDLACSKSEWVHSRKGFHPNWLCSHICSQNPGSAVKDGLAGINLTPPPPNQCSVSDIIKCSGGEGWTDKRDG